MTIDISYNIPNYNLEKLVEDVQSIEPGIAFTTEGINDILIQYPDVTAQEVIDTCAAIIEAHNPNDLTTEQNIVSHKQNIIDLSVQSKAYGTEIVALLNAVVTADFLGSSPDTRFASIRAAIAAQGTGFKSRFHSAMTGETGLTELILDAVPTDTQKQDYNEFASNFALRWSFMFNLS